MRFENLGNGYGVYISSEHGFGTDALLLGHFALPKRNDKACDLGSGCGIIPMIWCRDDLCESITAVEISKLACLQIERAVDELSLNDKISVVNADLRTFKEDTGKFDLVCMNPPYKKLGSGLQSRSREELVARHEVCCTIEDVAHTASRLLKFGGRLYICHKPERLTDIFRAFNAERLEPKRIKFVSQSYGKAPWLVLVEARKGGKPGLTVEPELYQKDLNGNDTDEIKEYYKDYRN